MKDIIIILVVLLIVAAIGFYIYKEKKSGKKCVGCPYAGTTGCSCNKK